MNERELLVDCLRRLNRSGVTYYLTGSMASNYWGIPRTTHDLDFVIRHGVVSGLWPDDYVKTKSRRSLDATPLDLPDPAWSLRSNAGMKLQFLCDPRAAFTPIWRFAFERSSFVRRAVLLFYPRPNSTTEPGKAL